MLRLKAKGQSARAIREVLGYSEKWICETVRRYNEEGPEAIRDRRRDHLGGKPMLSAMQQKELAGLLEKGTAPDGEPWSELKVVRWIESATGREPVHNQRGWEYLRRLGFTPQRPRRRHEAASAGKQTAFKNKLPATAKALRKAHPDLEVWALDEHRVGLPIREYVSPI